MKEKKTISSPLGMEGYVPAEITDPPSESSTGTLVPVGTPTQESAGAQVPVAAVSETPPTSSVSMTLEPPLVSRLQNFAGVVEPLLVPLEPPVPALEPPLPLLDPPLPPLEPPLPALEPPLPLPTPAHTFLLAAHELHRVDTAREDRREMPPHSRQGLPHSCRFPTGAHPKNIQGAPRPFLQTKRINLSADHLELRGV
jgi:hypothetical protein